MTPLHHPIIVQPSYQLHVDLTPVGRAVSLAFQTIWTTANRDGEAEPFRVTLDRAAIHRLRYALDCAEEALS